MLDKGQTSVYDIIDDGAKTELTGSSIRRLVVVAETLLTLGQVLVQFMMVWQR